MPSPLLAKKPIDQVVHETGAQDDGQGMRRTLGAANLTALGIGALIGAGIFVLTGQAAARYAGPAVALSFLISSLGCTFAGLCYAEFASMVPVTGSAYIYAYATLGEFVAWIIGWDLILEYLFGASTVAVGWSGYVVSFLKDFGLVLPSALTQAPCNLPAVVITLLITALLVVGIRESAGFNNVIVVVKLCVIALFIGFGVAHIKTANYLPFIPPNTGEFGHFGWSGVMRGAGVVFFAYIGFDMVSTAAQEARRPQRDMPVGILGSLAVATVLFVAVSLVLTGIVSYRDLNVADPIGVGVDAAGEGLRWLRPLVKVGIIAGLTSVILVLLLGQPRIFYAMAKDGLLPRVFATIHPRFRTPHVTTMLAGAVAAVLAGILPISVLGELVSIGTLLAFFIVCAAVLVLRRTQPDLPRPFRVPGMPAVPILGALISLAQMLSLPPDTWLRLVVWLLVGFAVYFSYGRRHSVVRRTNGTAPAAAG